MSEIKKKFLWVYVQIHDCNRFNDVLYKANQFKHNLKQKWMEADENTFTVNQFGVAALSKKETYSMLTITGGYYLPSVSLKNADNISDILSGDKNVSSNRSNDIDIKIY